MLEQIRHAIEKCPDRPAFRIQDTVFNYRDLARIVSKIKRAVDQQASADERLIGFLTYDDIETYSSAVAILFTRFGFVPINPENPLDRNASVIEQAEIKTILSSRRDHPLSGYCEAHRIRLIDTSALADGEIALEPPRVERDDIAYLLFTSGSTGVPKGVPLSRKNLYEFMNAFFALGYAMDETDRVLQMFDMTFDLSLMSYLAPLCRGACVYTVPPAGIKYANIYTILEEQEITVALMVPSIIAHLRPYFDEIRLGAMRYSLFCGEALYEDVAREWMRCVPNARVQNVYGPTEATIFCLTYDMAREGNDKSFNGIVSIGTPMNNMEAIVVDEFLKPVAAGEKGELCLAGSQLTSGYWKNPAKNREAFFTLGNGGTARRYYRTGDVAFQDESGDFMFGGRLDHQVKIQGFRVELSEIEHHAREFTGAANVVAVADDSGGVGNVTIHLAIENHPGDIAALSGYLAQKLPSYMLPAGIHPVSALPLNANGKIDRKAVLRVVKGAGR